MLAYVSIGEAENYRFYWEESWDADNDGQPDADASSMAERRQILIGQEIIR